MASDWLAEGRLKAHGLADAFVADVAACLPPPPGVPVRPTGRSLDFNVFFADADTPQWPGGGFWHKSRDRSQYATLEALMGAVFVEAGDFELLGEVRLFAASPALFRLSLVEASEFGALDYYLSA